ncbi:FCS-Like Zinc finger 8 [Mercurialis annua]|uniref:FCS-Like Zinc finger 8 n=1 Tax=Mercurialis annua TaxID=3986 RepID=UPI00216083CF|nr:FCS-Like Zinc finger 8 [Mercurialis annua]
MIRNRSRVISSKQALMADYSSLIPSPVDNYSKPRLFTGFTTFKNISETTESLASPTSTLDSKPFKTRTWDNLDSKGIGLAIVEALNHDDHKTDSSLSKSESRMVLFGSNLKIQVPNLPVSPTGKSPQSPGDFGIKTRNSQVGSFSSGYFHSPVKKSECDPAGMGMDTPNSSRVFNGYLSASEMELSEDYTCVISYGPNPKTTHIFEDCIVESCCGVVEFSPSKTEETNNGFLSDGSNSPSENFLSFCYACKKNLSQGNDVYMYRGEKAFCSSECRYGEMLIEAGIDKLDYEDDDLYGICSS